MVNLNQQNYSTNKLYYRNYDQMPQEQENSSAQPYGYPQQPATYNPYQTHPPVSPQYPGGSVPYPSGSGSGPAYGAPPPQGAPPSRSPWDDPLHKRQLTSEELAVLKECRSESFWRRCVPLSILASVAVGAGFQQGYIKPTPMKPFYFASAIGVAYFVGKLSYVKECTEKLKKLKNSPLADALLRGNRRSELFSDVSQFPGMGNIPDIQRDDAQYHQPYQGGDIYQNPEFVNAQQQPADLAGQSDQAGSKQRQPTTSYEELRRRNREEYLRKHMGLAQPGPPPPYGQQRPPSYGAPNGQPGYQQQQPQQLQPDDKSRRTSGDVKYDDKGFS